MVEDLFSQIMRAIKIKLKREKFSVGKGFTTPVYIRLLDIQKKKLVLLTLTRWHLDTSLCIFAAIVLIFPLIVLLDN